MITELYTFTPGSYVAADEWNANFRTINSVNNQHAEAIVVANSELAFPNSDLSDVFAAVRSRPNSHVIDNLLVDVAPEQEYYKILSNNEVLTINVTSGLNAEVRILIQLPDLRTDFPFVINYSGQQVIMYGDYKYFNPGYYYIMIYETNGLLQAKFIEIGAN